FGFLLPLAYKSRFLCKFAFESLMTESRDRKEKKLPVCARAVLPFPVQMKECRRMATGYIIRWNENTFVR
ncbi:hypothetical protein, partial [Segatella buccae]|uniref:hypothetical protein n=1 Tax=Segatella buccae TaxID=28126 RepID=UPI00248DDD47